MRILFLTSALCFTIRVFSQDHFCGSTEAQNKWFAAHPELKTTFEALQQQAVLQDKQFEATKNNQYQRIESAATYTIPIVFHILHTGGYENIPDAQVEDAVRILNRDYRKLNPDTSDVVVPFKNIIGDAKITFTLATKDPNGNCTNGIVRHFDSRTDWNSNDFSYYAYTWPVNKYLNVYVVKTINSNAAGYTYLPGSGIPSSGDAIVILSTYVGSIGSGNLTVSRALTHEVGHWFNLPHVWGGTNQPGVACGDDGVADTPVTEGFSSCALNNSDVCTPGVPENLQNYMDYSYCSKMFTQGQANRMQNAAASSINGRSNLWTANNLFATGITSPLATCIPSLDITAPATTLCLGASLTISSFTSNATPTAYLWTVSNGGVIANPGAVNAQITFPNAGTATITCNVSNANGSTTKSLVVTVLSVLNSISVTNDENFESVAIPASWTVINPNTPTVKWEITSNSAKFGLNSVYVGAENSPANNTEILESPSYNFRDNPGAQFSFYYAYARLNAANKDRFKLQASKDCGGTWVDVWSPTNQVLANSSAGTTTVLLIPEANDWVFFDVIQDAPQFTFQSEPNVKFRFSFTEDPNGVGYGNRIYLDDVLFTAPTVGLNEITKQIGFGVYPNPSNAAFTVNFILPETATIKYQVVSVTGAVVIPENTGSFGAGNHDLKINENGQLSKGIYFLNFELNGIKLNKKLIVN